MMKKLLIAAMIAGSLGAVSIPATSATTIYVRQAPPEPRVERVPQARRGYVWAPGHWAWKRNRHVWVKGHWVKARRGYVYDVPTWQERDGRWEMRRGGWRRGDRDGDGVPNGVDRDRDGDGVPNRVDDRPNNPVRN